LGLARRGAPIFRYEVIAVKAYTAQSDIDRETEVPKKPRLADTAYDKMLRHISLGDFRPGARLTEPFLCEALGMSRTPVREAINRLIADGLLLSCPYRSVTVRVFSTQDLQDLWMVREAFEVQAARLAAERIANAEIKELYLICDGMDEADSGPSPDNLVRIRELDAGFHHRLVELSGNRMLFRIYREQHLLQVSMFGFRYTNDPRFRVGDERRGQLHRPIVAAVASRDADVAEQAVRDAVRRAIQDHVKSMRLVREARAAGIAVS